MDHDVIVVGMGRPVPTPWPAGAAGCSPRTSSASATPGAAVTAGAGPWVTAPRSFRVVNEVAAGDTDLDLALLPPPASRRPPRA